MNLFGIARTLEFVFGRNPGKVDRARPYQETRTNFPDFRSLGLPSARRGTVLALVAALCAGAAPATAPGDAETGLDGALQRFLAMRTQIDARAGIIPAAEYATRLREDLAGRNDAPPPGYGDEDWRDTLASIAALDVAGARQLADGVRDPLTMSPGLHEIVIPSSVDGTWQSAALYVPASYRAGTRAPLVVALHGNPQTESQLLGQPYLRRLAERTGSVIVAPFARGIYDYAEPAATDVYDALAAVQQALPVDRGRTYLVGYSMGGFSLFKIGPRGGSHWRAVMCISGAILNSGVRAVSLVWAETPLYVVNGARDDQIPARYGEQTATYLAGLGLPVSFYQQPDGTHAVRTMMPVLTRAWDDMHAGAVRPDSVPRGRGFGLPQAAPPPAHPS